MERFYQWMSKANNPSGSHEALVICYNDSELSVQHVFSDIEMALKAQRHLPDCVYILGTSEQLSVFNNGWSDDQGRLANLLSRGVKNARVCVHEYVFLDWNGEAFNTNVLGGGEITYRHDPSVLLKHGLKTLIEKNNVIHSAPSAHSFKHPSGTLNNVFIQARELASAEAEVCVVGYAIALEYGARMRRADKVFIDTMGIYAFVKNALGRLGSKAEVMSFHSYERLKTMFPPAQDYFCVVSASTSGGMAKQMGEQTFREDCIATLIDRTADDRYGRVLVALDDIDFPLPVKAEEGCTLIEIIGENFSAKSKPPKSITISMKHGPKPLAKFHKYFGMGGIIGFNRSNQPHKLLTLDPDQLLADADFRRWLAAEIDWSVSMATNLIVYADDAGSKKLGEVAHELLSQKWGATKSIGCVPYSQLDGVDFDTVTGVLVATVVARDGGILREISRDLRAYMGAGVPRRFLVPIGIPQSGRAWTLLKSFLMKNPTARDYGFSNWLCLPIGDDGKENSWSRLVRIGSAGQVDDVGFTPNVAEKVRHDSIDMATELVEEHKHGFLPKHDGSALALSDGFLFFDPSSNVGRDCPNVPQSTVFFTIAAVLQFAREHEDHELRLQPTGYESVVLSPECFLRFNDNILQASFLRACLPSELDYSASPELSKLMKEFIAKVFARWERTYGDAALEFAAALATGSLKLTQEDMRALLEETIDNRKGEASSLLGLLLLTQRAQFPVPEGS
ncbi:hypothetical protein [Pseudomonas sp. A-RE-23]|uniref:hypothetical protein n=1 Tax=Pseudomonas TaxID=286 RepID=UPI001CBE3576|nr:hypothetical protein [Pseudomonas sp. A-RE-23]